MPRASAVNFSPRLASSAKSLRIWTAPTVLWWAFNAVQALRLISGLMLGGFRAVFAVAIVVFSFKLVESGFALRMSSQFHAAVCAPESAGRSGHGYGPKIVRYGRNN